MKRLLGLLVFTLLLNGCDDGDLTLETISFEDATTESCTTKNIIYKLKDKESLLLEIPENSFKNEPSLADTPTIIDISATNRVVYRFYDGTVSSSTICESIPPATPIVTDQWTATDGKIQIFTTAVKTTNTTDNSTKITGYNHNIVFKNITFAKSSGTQVYETFAFGDYVTSATPLPFLFDETVEQCSTSKQIYNYTSSEALILDIDPALIVNDATPLNAPRTGLISATANKLTYRLFSGLLTSSYFCNTTFPTTPAISEEWIAVSGVSNVSGIVEVTTTTFGTGFKHTIVLKNVTMKKGNNDFKLGDSYIYGELLTTI
ncbi:hypothetical protein [Flavobacterium gawalongense]|uniref:Lipoprotein n=1 Tax=Flavobacterium gawalongense TaxID=2594432 RepID=A0A553BRA1_9FLAO|nr:hypothetical protein [Flavobacterium gawalongense]TRX03442.1 hypothetical protein FNW33_04330 [Flavobacterium gawalongense]TRX06789.1 hypothetical protein FNW12_07450 [Flavobacterium gawalongense]TRX10790.1 hypothetical protein FNW11_07315 [Flavobacterium gawalongense]TRX11512.1 hypothetical protein FNW10_07115 [Flavobacterium gawalongense]TRX29282.1 hypothetical protein FNW38_07210 [Flavobacterium gawalongense]